MKHLLGTDLISELMKSRPKKSVVEWITSSDERSLYMSALTLGELQKGLTKLPESGKKARLQFWIENDLRPRFSGRILPVDEEVAMRWGKIQGEATRRGKRMPTIAGLIAATAITHDLIVVTRHKASIAESGARVFDPWNQA